MTQIFLETGKVVPVTVVRSDSDVTSEYESSFVDIVGTSKGKGFTGVMKKWGFHGSQATRGQRNKPRAAGAIGAQTPGKVWKGKKMAGRQGGTRVTVKSAKIVKVYPDKKEMLISGPIPGARNSKVVLKLINK